MISTTIYWPRWFHADSLLMFLHVYVYMSYMFLWYMFCNLTNLCSLVNRLQVFFAIEVQNFIFNTLLLLTQQECVWKKSETLSALFHHCICQQKQNPEKKRDGIQLDSNKYSIEYKSSRAWNNYLAQVNLYI